jgi:hypothetical protein
MLQATAKMYRDNGEMFFAWFIEDENGALGHMEDFPSMAHCEESMYRHIAMWAEGEVCSINGLLMTIDWVNYGSRVAY